MNLTLYTEVLNDVVRANSLTKHLIIHLLSEIGLFALHNYFVPWLFEVITWAYKSSSYFRVFWSSLYTAKNVEIF